MTFRTLVNARSRPRLVDWGVRGRFVSMAIDSNEEAYAAAVEWAHTLMERKFGYSVPPLSLLHQHRVRYAETEFSDWFTCTIVPQQYVAL